MAHQWHGDGMPYHRRSHGANHATQGTSDPIKVFDRTPNLAGAQIISYRVSNDSKWSVLIGITAGAPERWVHACMHVCYPGEACAAYIRGGACGSHACTCMALMHACAHLPWQPGHRPALAKGFMQLYSAEQQKSQPLEAHAASFANVKVRAWAMRWCCRSARCTQRLQRACTHSMCVYAHVHVLMHACMHACSDARVVYVESSNMPSSVIIMPAHACMPGCWSPVSPCHNPHAYITCLYLWAHACMQACTLPAPKPFPSPVACGSHANMRTFPVPRHKGDPKPYYNETPNL